MGPSNNFCDLVGYEVENYGHADFVENIEVGNGEFRRARAMLPFAYLNAKACDFKWDVYGQSTEAQKKIVNAFLLNFWKWRKAGKGLYIFSRTKGSGKTMLACCLANEVLGKLDMCVKFISIPEFLELTKDSYKDAAKRADIDGMRTAELLIIDDIGTEMKKEWVDSVLFRLIDWRYTNKLVTIFTSNVEMEDLKLDDRITDRIYDMCIQVNLPEKSIRRQKAKRENDSFMEEVLKNAQ